MKFILQLINKTKKMENPTVKIQFLFFCLEKENSEYNYDEIERLISKIMDLLIYHYDYFIYKKKAYNLFKIVYNKLINFNLSDNEIEHNISKKYLPLLFTECKKVSCNKVAKIKNELCEIHNKEMIEKYNKIIYDCNIIIDDLVPYITDFLSY